MVSLITRTSYAQKKNYDGLCIIPIIGPSGAGKSTFINQLLGEEVVEVGRSLNSCTIDLHAVEIPADVVQENLAYWNRGNLVIVDTPGFDDTRPGVDDSEILKRIASWLADTYGAGAKLAGVIYLQDICQRRITGATKRNFEVFDKLCGVDACKSVVLGTTHWTRVSHEEREKAVNREQELRHNFWREMILEGSTMQRVDDKVTNTSPWTLVQTVLFKGQSPALHIQRELIDMSKSIPQTEAAAMLRYRIEDLIKELKRERAPAEEVRALIREVEALKEESRFARFFRQLSDNLLKLQFNRNTRRT